MYCKGLTPIPPGFKVTRCPPGKANATPIRKLAARFEHETLNPDVPFKTALDVPNPDGNRRNREITR